jgi:hypothetical protein
MVDILTNHNVLFVITALQFFLVLMSIADNRTLRIKFRMTKILTAHLRFSAQNNIDFQNDIVELNRSKEFGYYSIRRKLLFLPFGYDGESRLLERIKSLCSKYGVEYREFNVTEPKDRYNGRVAM